MSDLSILLSTGVPHLQPWAPSRRHGKGHKADERLGTCHTRRGRAQIVKLLKSKEGLITVSKYLMRGGDQWGVKTKPDPSQWCPADRMRGNGLKMKYKKSHLNIRKIFYCLGNQTLKQVAPNSRVAIPGDVQKLPAESPDQPAPVVML